jgi:hypothetical protein
MSMSTLLLVLGMLLILSSVVLLFLPGREKYKTVTQKFSGLGVTLEFSLVTLIALLGVCLAAGPQIASAYWEAGKDDAEVKKAQDLRREEEKKNERLRGQIAALKEQLALAQKVEVPALLTLEGVTKGNRPSLTDLECTYQLYSEPRPVKVAMDSGVSENQFRVLLTEVDRHTVVQRLVVEERGKRRWSYENFRPMEPIFVMKEEK